VPFGASATPNATPRAARPRPRPRERRREHGERDRPDPFRTDRPCWPASIPKSASCTSPSRSPAAPSSPCAGLARQFGARWPFARSVRYASYLIDTLLLLAGIALVLILGIDPLATPWLFVKLLLLVLYVVLGSLAIKRARGRGARLLCYLGALAVFAAMYSVARTHHPLGALAGWLR
jgi:uncharacterized membrane protein SirB2